MDSVTRLPWLSPPAFPPFLTLFLSFFRQRLRGLSFTVVHFSLSGWFTLHWPGRRLPAPHYQLPARGTHCCWQAQGRGTPNRNSCLGEKLGGITKAPVRSPGPNSISVFRRTQRKTFISYHRSLLYVCMYVCSVWWLIPLLVYSTKRLTGTVRGCVYLSLTNHDPLSGFCGKKPWWCVYWGLLTPFGKTTGSIIASWARATHKTHGMFVQIIFP